MAALTASNLTLLDLAKLKDPDGSIATVVELLSEKNEILDDAVFQQGNMETGHRTTVRTGIPEPTWRRLYGRVGDGKSTTAQVTESCGNLQIYSDADAKLLELSGMTPAVRMSEEMAFIQGFKNKMARSLIYDNEKKTADAITGFTARFDTISAGGRPENAEHILNAGGTTSLTSIWCVGWGDLTCFGIVPKNSTAGLKMEDKGKVTSETSEGKMEVYRTHYEQDLGLCVRDWRSVARICNLDTAALRGLTGTQLLSAATSILRLMIEARERIEDAPFARPVFYMNKDVRILLQIAIVEKAANQLTFDTVAGKRVMHFYETPVRRVDQITSNETQVQ